MPPPSSRDGRDPSVAKKRKNDSASGDEKKLPFQTSPFEPAGKFRNRETMDIHYSIEPRKNWTDMTRYNSFVCMYTRVALCLLMCVTVLT